MNDLLSRLSRRWIPRAVLLLAGAVTAACSGGGEDAEAASETQQAAEAGDEHGAEEGVVVLDSAAIAIAGIRVERVETVQSTGLPVTGTITYDANLVSHIGPRTDGRIVRLSADIGERVRGGQTMAVLESPQVGQVRAESHRSEALVKIALENYQREQRLEQQGISSRKELLDAEAELRRMEADLQSAREQLQALGAGRGEGGQFALTAPFSGVVVAREASMGEMVSPSDEIFTVANLERLWIELDIYERDLARVTRGQRVEVSTAAYPNRNFPGQIVYLGDILDPQKRTVRARVEIPNESGALKPGMFATASIRVGGGGPPVVVVPEGAVQELEGRRVVFIPGDAPGEFRAVPVDVGEQTDNGQLTVLSGLQGGDLVVIAGAFALRSELAKGEIGEHGH